MSAYRDDFEKWVKVWEKSQVDFTQHDKEKEQQRRSAPQTSFFGMNSVDDEALERINESDVKEWRGVMKRANDLFAPVNEAKKEAKKEDKKATQRPSQEKSKKPKKADDKSLTGDADDDYEGTEGVFSKTKGGVEITITPNPIHFASVGRDSKMRVTPNWTAGAVLAAVAKIKSQLYDMECEMLTAEALGGNVKVLQDKLHALNKQFHAMSEMLTSDPKTDFS